MNSGRFCSLLALTILVFAPSTSRGITLGQIDTFEDGTKDGWTAGPVIQSTLGGPGGASDHYLILKPGVSTATMLLQFENDSQWTGNYLAAGVTRIEMDLINPSSSAMSMRIAIANGGIGGYTSSTAYTLPPDNQWHHAIFGLTADSLTAGTSPPPLNDFLANVSGFFIYDSRDLFFADLGPTGFGIDNVHAIPEPASISILLSGIVGIALLRRRRTKR